MTALVPCPDCGALVPDIEGPVHRYLGASPGCWAAYGELQARSYNGAPLHRLAVDVYAAQHPGVPGRQSSQSVAAHLYILCLTLERGLEPALATETIRRFVDRHKASGFEWMEPPASLGEITVLDVLEASGAEAHNRAVLLWARSVWSAWEPHHATVRAWADQAWD